jgi:hypothetical protein
MRAVAPAQKGRLDRLSKRVRRGLQALADIGQFSCREVYALLLGVRALAVALGPLANLFELTRHLLHGVGEGRQLAGDARDVLFGGHSPILRP